MRFLYNISLVLLSFSILSCSEDKAVVGDYTKKEEKVETTGGVFLTQKEAAVIARKFIKARGILGPQTKSKSFGLDMVYTDVANEVKTKSGVKPAFYVFNIEDSGFIIVSSSKATLPILGYSTESKFNGSDIPVNLADVLGSFKSQVTKITKKNKVLNQAAQQVRQSYLTPDLIKTKASGRSVKPLLGNMAWAQSPYYNAYCPDNTPLGCVATATAQIMRYYKYPKASTGKASYENENYGEIAFNYDYTINWDAMPKRRLTRHNEEVAKLCYGVAVGLEMTFTPNYSEAYQSNVVDVAVDHYGYAKGIRQIYRLSYKNNLSKWEEIIKTELRAGRPVQYSGYSVNRTGHSFVCDGYDEPSGFFHFNWGWGGKSNGYFLLSSINPEMESGRVEEYDIYHEAIVGFQPPADDVNTGNSNNKPKPKPSNDAKPTNGYCKPNPGTADYCYIKKVAFGGMKNKSGASNGYVDYSNKKIHAKAGQRLDFKFTPGFSNDVYKMYWNVWIDYDKDQKFMNGTSENVIHYSSTKSGTDYIYVPEKIKKGSYRVRISMKYGDYSKPCEDFEYGEVEDYTLVIE